MKIYCHHPSAHASIHYQAVTMGKRAAHIMSNGRYNFSQLVLHLIKFASVAWLQMRFIANDSFKPVC
jgi:hypothetical protein